MDKKTYSTTEPAERPFKVDLSASEIIALSNWHLTIASKIPKKVGEAAMKFTAENLFKSSRNSKALFAHARQQIEAHTQRSKGLLSILK